VEQDHRGTIGGTGFRVSNIEEACIDLLQRTERWVRVRLTRGNACPFCVAGFRFRGTGREKVGGSNGCSHST
jgi:hypothetical protein